MSTYKTEWGLYQISRTVGYGNSRFYETEEEALEGQMLSSFAETYILEQTTELED